MNILFQVTICSVVAFSTAQLNYDNPRFVPNYEQTPSTYTLVQELPREETAIFDASLTEFQPPRPDAPRPFYVEEPSEDLKAPTKDAVIFNYDPAAYPPVPSEDLQLPSEEKWNPNNDPNLYYPTEIPTKLYPKKYNKDSEKLGLKTKTPLTDEELAEKKRLVDKVLLSLAKQENKKRIQQERLEKERLEQDQEESYDSYKKVNDTQGSASHFVGLSAYSAPIHKGLSRDGDRMEFQVHGHEGPKTYKWGYDTGKG